MTPEVAAPGLSGSEWLAIIGAIFAGILALASSIGGILIAIRTGKTAERIEVIADGPLRAALVKLAVRDEATADRTGKTADIIQAVASRQIADDKIAAGVGRVPAAAMPASSTAAAIAAVAPLRKSASTTMADVTLQDVAMATADLSEDVTVDEAPTPKPRRLPKKRKK